MRDFRPGYRMPVSALTSMRWWYLYRFYDADSQLLYVGVTGDPHTRWQQHRRRSAWSASAETVSLERYAYEDLALVAERAAIRLEQPLHNIRSTDAGDEQQRLAGKASAHARSNAPSNAPSISVEHVRRADATDGRTIRTLDALPLAMTHDTYVTRGRTSIDDDEETR